MNNINIFDYLKNEGQLSTLHVYSAKEIQIDPYEHNTEKIFLNPLPIKALVQQISFSALRWKYTGLLPSKSIQIIAELKYESLFMNADKIKYNNEFYGCLKDDSKNFMIMRRSNYIVVVLGIKNQEDL